jgi:hypothetical protein
MKTLICSSLLVLTFFASCTKDRLTGNGRRKTESRTPGTFTAVHGSGDTDIRIVYGTSYKVELRGSDNLLPYFTTTIRNNTLYLQYEDGVSVHDDDIEATVTLPLLEEVSITGSGDADLSGGFPKQNNLLVRITGSAEVEAEGTLEYENLVVDISGSGDAELERVAVKTADIQVSGSGNAYVNAQTSLKARISGSGRVYYWGSPSIESQISGSGKVVKK